MSVRGGTGESGASVHALPWQVHAASAIGAAHVKDGRPNQDAVAHQVQTRPGGSSVLVVAIADGHGDPRHFRSDRGAKMAVAAGISAMRDWSVGISGRQADIKQSARRGLVPGIVAGWNAAVAADLAGDQLTAAERVMLAGLGLPPQTAYGSTLLIGAFTDGHAVFAQIGDGNIVAVAPDGRATSPVPGDGGPDRSHTASLCQDDASAAFRIGVIQLAVQPVFAALLATDGFGNAQAQDPWQADVAAELAGFGRDHDQDWFAAQVPGWAAQCASSAGSGDDSTIALVINSAVTPSRGLPGADLHGFHTETMPAQTLELPLPPALRPVSGDRSDRAPDERRPGWPRNRAGTWAAAAIAVVLAVLLLGFLLLGHGQR